MTTTNNVQAARDAIRDELQAIVEQEQELDKQRKKLERALKALGDDKPPPKRVQVGRGVAQRQAAELLENWPEGQELTAKEAAALKEVNAHSMGVYLRHAEKQGQLVSRQAGRALAYRPSNTNGHKRATVAEPGNGVREGRLVK